MGAVTFDEQIEAGAAELTGDREVYEQLKSTLVDFDLRFELLPGTGASPDPEEPNLFAVECTAPGFLDSGLTVFASTPPRPARGGRVAPGPGFGSRTSPASTARCTSA